MYLKSLEITGFKSFSKKSKFDFDSSISAIVGPNGSGKSNVAEAFSFVLGEQSIKSMRGKRGEDLIFNGVDGAKTNRASVKLILDNKNRNLKLDFDEVTIERVVHRDNANEYFINGSQTRLKDIQEILAYAHIGSTGHHIISQGEADRILTASVKERREMVEDALGLKIYQYKKKDSQKKLDSTQENIKSVESLKREIAPHLKFLGKQIEKIDQVESYKKNLLEIYIKYFKTKEIFYALENDKYKSLKSPLTDELKIIHVEIENVTNKIKKNHLGQEIDQSANIQKKIGILNEDKQKIIRQMGILDGELSYRERELEKKKYLVEGKKSFSFVEIENMYNLIKDLEDLSQVKKIVYDLLVGDNNTKIDTVSESEEIKLIISKRQKMEKDFKSIDEEIHKNLAEYESVKNNIDKNLLGSKDLDNQLIKLNLRLSEIEKELYNINNKITEINFNIDLFKKEFAEAYMIFGREVNSYKEYNGNLYTESEVKDINRDIEKLKIRIEESGVGNSGEIRREYKETVERDEFLTREIDDLKTSKLSLENLIKELDERLEIDFKKGVLKINVHFQNYFNLMFGGGVASLEVVKIQKGDLDEIASNDGLDISVSLPKKRTKGLLMLSGGERALTSIAILFAISQVNPPPFIILDETDAALDEANSRKYGDMIDNLSKMSQLILITHNRETMARAGVLYGVTMSSEGSSKLLSIKFEEAVKVAK